MVVTLQPVAAHAPSHALVGRLCSTFGLDPVDYDGIREATKDQIGLSAEALQPTVNDTAMKIHLQRVVGSFVSSAHGAAQFYGGKVTQARDLTSKLANDDRDEDREGVCGFESLSPAPARFAAEADLTAYALMACGRGRGRCLQRHHRRQVEAVRAAGRRPSHRRPPGGEAEIAGFG
jgi:hypothetical protein